MHLLGDLRPGARRQTDAFHSQRQTRLRGLDRAASVPRVSRSTQTVVSVAQQVRALEAEPSENTLLSPSSATHFSGLDALTAQSERAREQAAGGLRVV
jgi:hypothetical protein